LLSLFSDSLVGITPQGWLRQWNGEGKVSVASWSDATQVLPKVNVLVFSPEDVGGDKGLMESYAQAAPLTVLTRGLKGAVLCQEGEIFYFPSRPAREIDPTGAGDVFAAAFLVRLEETEDPHEATRFANCVASFSVEGPGVQSIPWRAQVDKWLADNPRWGHGKGGWGELMGPSPCEPG
ncbi:MAG: carbohydrate kinase family protein, partial [Anaerolineae bacterium]